jgi:hypothetical protein
MDVEAMKKAGVEADKEIEANKKRYNELWKRVTDPNARQITKLKPEEPSIWRRWNQSRIERRSLEACRRLCEKTKEARATLDAGDRTLENYRAQART